MPVQEDKIEFLRYELGILTLKAALSTRAGGAPIYSAACREHQRAPIKSALRRELRELETAYSYGNISSADHCNYIASLANRISQTYRDSLHNGRFRYGISQKLINLHLKYLWSIGLIEEPPHCPLDGIVRDLANLNYDWTTSDSQEEYMEAIRALERLAQPRSLSVWELQEFRRREQENA
jgi:hypothetical protein